MFDYYRGIAADLILAALSLLILKNYFEVFFASKEGRLVKHLCWSVYFIWQFLIGRANVLPAYVNVIISITLVSIVCIVAYKGNVLQRIVFSVLINAIWMLAEFLVGYGFILCGIHYMVPQFLGSLLSKLITLALISGLKRFFNNEHMRNLSGRYNVMLLLIPVGSMFVVYNIFMLSVKMNQKKYIEESWTSSIIILLINIIIFRMYLLLSKEKELQKYNTVYAQQLELCDQHIREKETVMMEFRNARHDMKQHFIVLLELLDKADNPKAMEYLRKLVDMEPLGRLGISRTDNIVVDSLVNAKYAVAVREQIRFEVDIHIPMQLPFQNADLCILLGNILDNAIEASEQLEAGRYIKFYMKYEKNALIITVINAYSGELVRDRSGKIVTNKGDSGNHGIGLESVKKVSEKYHGSVVVEAGEKEFKIKILLCDLPRKLQPTS